MAETIAGRQESGGRLPGAHRRAYPALPWAVAVALVTLAVALAATLRWERPLVLTGELRAPAWSRLLRSETSQEVCRWWLETPGKPEAVLRAQVALAEEAGWHGLGAADTGGSRDARPGSVSGLEASTDAEEAAAGRLRAVLAGERGRLLVTVRAAEPSRTRLRLQLRPCAGADSDSDRH